MRTYVLRRLLMFGPTLVGVSLVIFILMRLVPGDIAQILVYQTGSESSAIQETQIQQIRAELGLDQPLAAQYLSWAGDALRGDFGYSFSLVRFFRWLPPLEYAGLFEDPASNPVFPASAAASADGDP